MEIIVQLICIAVMILLLILRNKEPMHFSNDDGSFKRKIDKYYNKK
jgi:hypothetical protein